jgi:hypothetical protein
MICYASHTGTGRNLEALRQARWRIFVSRCSRSWAGPAFLRDLATFDGYALDPGAWADHNAGRPFDEDQFERLIELLGAGADFIVLPDRVAGGLASLELSVRWLNRCLGTGAPRVLIAVQNGMEPADLAPLVGPNVGIFLGGSTDWKLRRAVEWGRFCHQHGCYYHFARVNTVERFALAHDAGADSVDGTSATRYATTLPLLERGRNQLSLLNVRREAAA